MVRRNVLLNPGPATTTDSVKQAQVVPDICPREEEFGSLMRSCAEDIVEFSGGSDHVCVFFAGSGTAGMEAMMSSIVPPDGKALVINNGAYGARMVKIAKAYGIPVEELKFEWNEQVDPRIVDKSLSKGGITTVIMIHYETTTGILNPVKEVGEVVKKHGCVFGVDAISSSGGIPFSVEEMNMDFMISTSNKCVGGMAGITFIVCKRPELEKLKDYPPRTLYLNLWNQYEYFRKTGQMAFTPPVQTFYALRQAIDEYIEETPEGRWARFKESNKVLVEGMRELGFKTIYSDDVPQSRILTTFWEPDHPKYSFDEMHDGLFDKGFTIYPGKIKERTFRIANMGAIDKKDIERFLEVMSEVLDDLGVEL